METRKIIILGAMVLMGGGVFYAMQNLGAPAPAPIQQPAAPQIQIQEVEYVPVLAIDADVSTGQRITEEMLTSIKWPAEASSSILIYLLKCRASITVRT